MRTHCRKNPSAGLSGRTRQQEHPQGRWTQAGVLADFPISQSKIENEVSALCTAHTGITAVWTNGASNVRSLVHPPLLAPQWVDDTWMAGT